MPPFRNFLARKPAAANGLATGGETHETTENQRSAPLSFGKSCEEGTNEIKLSVVNEGGVYLPPSPPEKQSFWRKYQRSTGGSSNHRSLVDENEPFFISRESFDSYRRSFDISARSPVSYADAMPSRTSLDSSRFSSLASPSASRHNFEQPEPTEEEKFEDVGLNDDAKPKRKGIFSRLGDSSASTPSDNPRSSTTHLGFHLPGRKRGQSGTTSELWNMKPPPSAVETTSRET